MKGKIIVIDNEVPETRDFVVKSAYILAHSEHVSVSKYRVAD